MTDKKKDPLAITDLPDQHDESSGVKGGMASRPKAAPKTCNTNTITCPSTTVGCE